VGEVGEVGEANIMGEVRKQIKHSIGTNEHSHGEKKAERQDKRTHNTAKHAPRGRERYERAKEERREQRRGEKNKVP
jgi:hypothetical protein